MSVLGRFHPSFEGTWRPEALARDFARKLAARVRSGLLPAAKDRRNRYEILSETDESVRFRSSSLLTGVNIGWNDVEIRMAGSRPEVEYRVSYWAWTRFCVLLGLGLGVVFAVLVVVPVLTGWHLFPASYYPSKAEVKYFAVPMMAFWCLLWPWILVAMHKAPARRGFEDLLSEVNSEVGSG